MQTSLETLGQLERRLNVAVPLAAIENEVAKRLARLAKNVKIAGFRPGKVPMKMVAQQYGPQVRSEVISDTVQASFSDAVRDAAAARRRLSADRAQGRRRRPTTSSSSRRSSRSIRRSSSATSPTVTIERPLADVGPADVASTIEALRKQRVRYEADRPPGGRRRPRDRRLHRPHRRRRVPGRAGEGLPDHARRGPDAAGVRRRADRRAGRRHACFSADLPGRLPRQGSRREDRRVRR